MYFKYSMTKTEVAAVIFINKDREVLLHLRDNKSTIPYPNFWALLGGHVEDDENSLKALKREIKEEIGYEIKNPVFLGTLDDQVGNIVYIYRSEIDKKIDELKLNEGQKLGYFNFEQLIKLKIPESLRKLIIDKKDEIFRE